FFKSYVLSGTGYNVIRDVIPCLRKRSLLMPTFTRNGIELYYEDIGEGRPLLLLHGLTSNSAMFYREIEFFKDKQRIIALDSRGHGNSSRHDAYTLQDHIEDANALLSYLKLDTVDVLGVSMGSYIAQGLAIQYAEKVKKLILVAKIGRASC